MIPGLGPYGYLPPGTHVASELEILQRFGRGTKRRLRLGKGLSEVLGLARAIGAVRVVIDGSFVSAKSEPADIDGLVIVPVGFKPLGEELSRLRRARDLFDCDLVVLPAHEKVAIRNRIEFFSTDRDGIPKGLVEVSL